jgi:hypothetical protein
MTNTDGNQHNIYEEKKKMSFFLDVWMLIIIGIAISLIGKKFYKEDSYLKPTLSILVLALFYFISISLFCELNGTDHGIIGSINESFFNLLKWMFAGYYETNPEAAGSSTEFMFSSGQQWLKDLLKNNNMDFNSFAELSAPGPQRILIFLGIWMFAMYPLWLYLGIKIGVMLFGRKPGDKGIFGVI